MINNSINMNKGIGMAIGAALLFLGLAGAAPARADGPIYLCDDGNGHKELTDTKKAGNCRPLDLPGAITSPPKRPATAAAKPAAAAPADFPKVDNAAQKARDADRRQILEDELASEEKKLADLRKDYNNGEPERQGNERNYAKYQERVAQMKDDLSRAEKNVEALRREIANIK